MCPSTSKAAISLLAVAVVACSAQGYTPAVELPPNPSASSTAPPLPPPGACVTANKVSIDRLSTETRVALGAFVQDPSYLPLVSVRACTVEFLSTCKATGSFRTIPVQLDDTQTFGAGEIREQLSDGTDLLGKDARSDSSITRTRRTRGLLGFEPNPGKPWQDTLTGNCRGATHIVKSISRGASELVVKGGATVKLGVLAGCPPPAAAAGANRRWLGGSLLASESSAPTPPAAPEAPSGCDAPLELQLEAVGCPDKYSEWSGSGCTLKPITPELDALQLAELARQIPPAPSTDAERRTAASGLLQAIAALCGKSGVPSTSIDADACVPAGPRASDAIVLSAGHLVQDAGQDAELRAEGWYWQGSGYSLLGERAKAFAAYRRVTEFQKSPRAPLAAWVFAAQACSDGHAEEARILFSQMARTYSAHPIGKKAALAATTADKECRVPWGAKK
jgi:hypothetical protein